MMPPKTNQRKRPSAGKGKAHMEDEKYGQVPALTRSQLHECQNAFLSTGDLLIRMPVLLPPGTEQACPHSSPGMHPVPSCVSIDTIPSNLLVHRLSPVDHPHFHRGFHLPAVLDSLLKAATRNRCIWKKSSTAGTPAWDFHTIRFALGISQWALWNNAST